MISSKFRVAVPAACALLAVACESETKEWREDFNQKVTEDITHDDFNGAMIRNAAAYNMVVADGHFFPHTAELNSLGAQQLDRIGQTLERFSGTVRYETRSEDEELVAMRLKNVEQYLTDTGLDTTSVKVTAALSGGRTVLAVDAIQSKYKALNASESSQDSATSLRPEGE